MANNNNINDWERHPDIQNFLNIVHQNDLTKPIVISAYIKRDEGMSINIEDTHNLIIRKLGLSDEIIKDRIENKYKNLIQENLNIDINSGIVP